MKANCVLLVLTGELVRVRSEFYDFGGKAEGNGWGLGVVVVDLGWEG